MKNKVCLLTSSAHDDKGIGPLFIHSLIDGSSDFFIIWKPLLSFGLNISFLGSSVFSRVYRASFSRLRDAHSARLWLFYFFLLDNTVRSLRKFLDEQGVDVVWVTASSPELIWVADKLSSCGYDVRVTVWDAPEYLLDNLKVRQSLRQKILSSFRRLLGNAKRVSVIGESMRSNLQEDCHAAPIIIRHGVEGPLVEKRLTHSEDVNVVFAGSLYAKNEWNGFISALESVGWSVAGRNVNVSFIGRFPLSGAIKPSRVRYYGELSFSETLNILEGMDIGYLPYWFSEKHALVARTSFPGKLSAYAAAGLAIYHHAPAYSDAAKFLNHNRFGVVCSSMEQEAILAGLAELIDLAQLDECQSSRRKAFETELSRDAMYERFKTFLGLE